MATRLIVLDHRRTTKTRWGDAGGEARARSDERVQARRGVREANPPDHDPERRAGAGPTGPAKALSPRCREKPLASRQVTVPQTDTGRRGEHPKALERTRVKELGKMSP